MQKNQHKRNKLYRKLYKSKTLYGIIVPDFKNTIMQKIWRKK